MKKYLILRKAQKVASADKATRGLESFGTVKPAISSERLTERSAASMSAEPEVEVVTPVMPTSLIKPLDVGDREQDERQWGLAAIGAIESRFDGSGVKVAVLDTGIADHSAFEGVSIEQRDFSGDGDGDRQGHGTHCAGTIFGRDVGHRIGVARGVTQALIGKVLRDNGGGDSEMIFEGMQWALTNKANIISMSLGFDFPGMVEEQIQDNWPADLATSNALEAYRGNLRMFDAIMGLARARGGLGGGALVIAAAGNESRRHEDNKWRIAASLPAAAEDVISVAAVDRDGEKLKVAPFSNSMAVISGPGVGITSAWPGGGLHTISGTSMACPHVAGLAALWWHAVREGGQIPTPLNVGAKLIGNARHDLFDGGSDEADIGQGLAVAP